MIRNHMGSSRAGSNPAGVAVFVALRRLWSRGYDVRFPTVRPGFESRRAQALDLGFDPSQTAFLAEWSKALDLSSSIRKNAQVRTLQKAVPFLVYQWHLGRVVKAVDSKSTGIFPQRFESSRCRHAALA